MLPDKPQSKGCFAISTRICRAAAPTPFLCNFKQKTTQRVVCLELVMGVGPMNLVITNDALYQLSYTSEPFMTLTASTGYIILSYADICKDFF